METTATKRVIIKVVFKAEAAGGISHLQLFFEDHADFYIQFELARDRNEIYPFITADGQRYYFNLNDVAYIKEQGE